MECDHAQESCYPMEVICLFSIDIFACQQSGMEMKPTVSDHQTASRASPSLLIFSYVDQWMICLNTTLKTVIAFGKQGLIFSIMTAAVPKNRFMVMEPVMVNLVSTWLGHAIQIFGQTQVWMLM